MMFKLFKKKTTPEEPEKQFPPVPDWRPEIVQPLERVIDRFTYYCNGKNDFALFRYGTVVLFEAGLSDQTAATRAMKSLHKVFHAHPDMRPQEMDDGNILISYNHNVANVVLNDLADSHWEEIDSNHQGALVTDEVLITPLGQNTFDEFGKKALFGRCYMFMDAQSPTIVKIIRNSDE